VQFLERQLAYHIGPVAALLVKRAVAKATDREQLSTLLAAELDSEAARKQFIEAWRTLPRPTA
jgi:eukaryotic-like serine/threonine-protein kinase